MRGDIRRQTENVGEHTEAGWLVMKYAVIYERCRDNWGAFVPDLPGYSATAATVEELRALVREGVPFHIEGLRLAGEPVPDAKTVVDTVETA